MKHKETIKTYSLIILFSLIISAYLFEFYLTNKSNIPQVNLEKKIEIYKKNKNLEYEKIKYYEYSERQ